MRELGAGGGAMPVMLRVPDGLRLPDRRRSRCGRCGSTCGLRDPLPAHRVQRAPRQPRRVAHAAGRLAAGHAPRDQPVDLRPRPLQRGLAAPPPRPRRLGPSGRLAAPRPPDDDHDLAPRRDPPSAARSASSPSDPRTTCSWSLVSSRQTAPGRSGPQAAARSRSVAAGAARRLEQHAPPPVRGDRRQPLAPLAPAPGQEPLERPARAGDAARRHRRQHRRGARAPARPRRPRAAQAATRPSPGIGHDRASRRR